MYRGYDVKIKKVDADKVRDILTNRENIGDIDRWRFSRWDENTLLCSITPIVSDDLEAIMDEFKEAGIQVL